MAFELIYTSAQAGVRPGSTGFCTVAMTSGMPPALVSRLESLTGYRHLYAVTDSRYAQNPPSFLHYRVSIGGTSYAILGRVWRKMSVAVCGCAPLRVIDQFGRRRASPRWSMYQETSLPFSAAMKWSPPAEAVATFASGFTSFHFGRRTCPHFWG